MELYHPRSAGACLRAAFDNIKDNWRAILRVLWLPILIYAAFYTAALYFRLPNLALHNWGEANPLLSFFIQTDIYSLAGISEIILIVFIAKSFNHDAAVRNFLRYGKFLLSYIIATAVFVVISVILGIIYYFAVIKGMAPSAVATPAAATPTAGIAMGMASSSTALILSCVFLLIILIAAIVVFLPMLYVFSEYMLNDDAKLKNCSRFYRVGLKHCGSAFWTLIVTLFMAIVAYVMITLPAIILTLAQFYSQIGALLGDPSGTPGYFMWLIVLTLFAGLTLSSIVIVWAEYVCFYYYGSIKAQEMARQNRKEAQEALLENNLRITEK